MSPFSSDSGLFTLLSKRDAIALLELIYASLTCTTQECLTELMESIKSLLPFDYGLCGFAKIDEKGMKSGFDLVNSSYPREWLDVYVEKNYLKIDPIVKEHLAHFDAQFWDDTYKKYEIPKKFISESRDFGLLKGYTYGLKNSSSKQVSLFSFAGPDLIRDERTEAIIRLVTPHLHQCYLRINQEREKMAMPPLSEREREVLNWLGQGKSSWEISIILAIGERTVKFHVENIKNKLNATSRAHAVAIALDLGLITF